MSAMQIKGSGEGTSHEQEDLEQGKKVTEDHLKLYKAALKGDWNTAQEIYNSDQIKADGEITNRGETALHIAAKAGQTHFVEELVKLMNEEGLLHKTEKEDTAFHFAVMTGKVELAKAIMEKEDFEIPLVFASGQSLLSRAAGLGHREMVGLLYEVNKVKLSDEDRKDLLVPLIEADMYDIALDMLKEHPEVAAAGLEASISSKDSQDNCRDGTNAAENEKPIKTPLLALAEKRYTIRKEAHQSWTKRTWAKYTCKLVSGFSDEEHEQNLTDDQKARKILQRIWEEITLKDRESRLDDFHFKPIFLAAERGNVEFLNILVNDYPDIIFKKDENGRTIFHVAVLNRHLEIFNLMHEFGEVKNLITTYIDVDENNILHLAGMLPPSRRSGVVLGAYQLGDELKWFERVKKEVKPWLTVAKNKKGLTPRALCEREHEDMRKEVEKLMIRTAKSCTLVGTLIATVVFPAAFTVPGGTRQDTGIPILLENYWFQLFVQYNAAALGLSICSVVAFLSILTSRFRLDDFRCFLPVMLIFGLVLLGCSAMFMIGSFEAAVSVVSDQGRSTIGNSIWVFILVLVIGLFHFRSILELGGEERESTKRQKVMK